MKGDGLAVKSKLSDNERLRSLPAMDQLLGTPSVEFFSPLLGRETVKTVLSEALEDVRKQILRGEDVSPSVDVLLTYALPVLEAKSLTSLRPVVNAMGVVIHTNLGRACLADEAVNAVVSVAGRYSTLEFDIAEGRRGQRSDHVEWLLRRMSGAEAGIVVNNNAGAVLLMLAALCAGKEVIVSRGELVEIGGSFRIPDIMAFSGAHLVEVGATNRTHARDYLDAITEKTAAVLKVHPSNFRMEGFTSSVPREELASIAREKEIFFLEDLGSGTLLDLSSFGLKGEPTVSDCLRQGVNLVTFSGDKMLGGPQIGGIVGKKTLLDKLRTHPLLRALRVDKMTLAAFEATLRLYLSGRIDELPVFSMLRINEKKLFVKARALAKKLRKALPSGSISVIEVEDAVGGGAFPAEVLPGWGVTVSIEDMVSTGSVLGLLRNRPCPVIAGAREGMVVFHVRTLLPGDDERICDAFREIVSRR